MIFFLEEKTLLKLKQITKDYVTGNSAVHALRGVSIEFRKSEFVSILGPSGCGKTTLLNIIGGLDRYTDGDLIINGKSTKTFKDSDWDSYRNHSIGFVFQSYNLIPHQSVLSNVELALTLSGVSKTERRKRAIAALESVGLGDQIHKKPSQMSGGQMQRVAIARALVNDPDILLADEPTGALDTTTSVQIMEILKEISKNRLIIMVTHNPELAEAYSTRIIRVIDGLVTDDSNPYSAPVDEQKVDTLTEKTKKQLKQESKKDKKESKSNKTSMSFWTALSLSFNNLRTKKGRTIMTSFAGSIGIIGIALILALSTGINAFIAQVQEDTLSTYPLTIQKHTQDMTAMLEAMTSSSGNKDYSKDNVIGVDDSLGTMMGAMSSTVENNLEKFKAYIDANYDDIDEFASDIQYVYDYNLQVYTADGKIKIGMETLFKYMGDAFSGMSDLMEMGGGMGMDVFSEMINNQDILNQQYDVIAGNWPTKDAHDEVVLVVNSNNQISKMTLYMLGILDPAEIEDEMKDLMSGNYKPSTDMEPFTYDYFLDLKFKLLTTADFYDKVENLNLDIEDTYTVDGVDYPVWKDIRDIPGYDQQAYVTDKGVDVKIVGIVRPKDGAAATSISGAIGYTKALTDYILHKNANTEVINQQKETENINVLTGIPFERTVYTRENIDELIKKIDSATMDMFYSVITNTIKDDPDKSNLLNVTRANINTMFMLLPDEQQADILSRVIASAVQNNPAGTERVFQTMSSMTGGIDVNEKNVITLLPILNKMETMPLLTSLGIPGLVTLADEAVVTEVVNGINDKHPEFAQSPFGAVTKETLAMYIGRLPAEEQTEIYTTLIGSVNEGNDTMLAILCGILSSQAQTEITKENLAQTLPTLAPEAAMVPMLALGGMPGFVDYADAETMDGIYTDMNELMINLKVNDKIFSLLLVAMPDDMFAEMEETLYNMAPQIDATYDSVLETLDDAEKAKPDAINFFAKDFESKEKIEAFIADYNAKAEEKDKLEYTDVVGTLMSSVTIIVNAISYVLIAFVAISLVVSSIMIGIITNISVLERTKEIGILRAIGASKKDVSRVFNAETLIIGLAAGAIGIIMTLILCVPITAIVQYFTGLDNIRAILPWDGAIILVIISMVLTLVAGIIPSRSAAKKDPVIALRSE
ncbi:MAG: ABC transporter ATP-binding protein/permease [Ruminococcaceae bacterium]|nr:ABC transporter ATP-binding protein/permease [Oscillospiraceae bacterium]